MYRSKKKMFADLEVKFETIETCLKDLKRSNLDKTDLIKNKVENVFDLEKQYKKIDNKRKELLNMVSEIETEQLKSSSKINQTCFMRMKPIQENLDFKQVFISNLSRLSIENDLNIFQKFRYYHLFNYKEPIHMQQFCPYMNHTLYLIDMNNYVGFNEINNELSILNLNFELVKSIPINQVYSLTQLLMINSTSRFLLNLGSEVNSRTFVCIFDKKLNLLKQKVFNKAYVYLRLCQDMFFFWDVRDYMPQVLLYNLNFELLDTLNVNRHLDIVLRNENRLCFNYFEAGFMQIKDWKSGNIIKELPTKGFQMAVMFVDMQSHLFLLYQEVEEFCLNCFDADGNLIFSQRSIFRDFNDFSINGENVYLLDDYLCLGAIF